MLQEEESTAAGAGIPKAVLPGDIQITKSSLITIAICTGLSVLFMNTGFLSFFYLVPLGYAIIVTGSFTVTFIIAAAATVIYTLISRISNSGETGGILPVIYFLTALLGFSWIIGGKNFRTLYRFIAASVVSAITFLVYINHPSIRFFEMFHEIAVELFGVRTNPVPEGDVTRIMNSFPMLSPDAMVETAKAFLLRGGSVISMFILFYINRQIALTVVSIVKKQRIDTGLIAFFAPSSTIWVFIGALISILMTRTLKIEIIEIAAWNVFVICAIIFLAQGAGILMHWMLCRTSVFRLVISVLVIVLVFSPLNMFVLAGLIILGIADNWLSLRTPRASTPGPDQ
ncbi:MAG: hypothetical protein FWD22_00475 [Treponema sp.]|nr:hypothetical protein [Treponema sp.]